MTMVGSTVDPSVDSNMMLNASLGLANSTDFIEPESLKPIEIIRLFLSCLGLVGNTLSFVVFSRAAFTHLSVSVFLRILAVLDNGVIIVYNIVSVHHSFTTPEVVTVEMGQLHPVGAWFIASLATSSAWILVLVSIERVSAVCIPFHVRDVFTKTRAIIAGLAVIPLSFVANLSVLLLKPRIGDAWAKPEIFAILYSGIPSLILITANSIVLVTLYRRRGLLRNQAEKRGVSIMLIVSCVVFVVLTISFPIYEVCTTKTENDPTIRSTLITITGLNHAVNFIFYGLSGSLFRQELKMMCCRRFMDIPRQGSSSRKSTELGSTPDMLANGTKGRYSRENSAISYAGSNARNTVRESTVDLAR